MDIKVKYSSVDGYRKTRTFKTLKFAQKFAQEWIGEHPDLGGGYAVSFDGVGKIEVSGATLNDLFPSETDTREYDPETGEPHGYSPLCDDPTHGETICKNCGADAPPLVFFDGLWVCEPCKALRIKELNDDCEAAYRAETRY